MEKNKILEAFKKRWKKGRTRARRDEAAATVEEKAMQSKREPKKSTIQRKKTGVPSAVPTPAPAPAEKPKSDDPDSSGNANKKGGSADFSTRSRKKKKKPKVVEEEPQAKDLGVTVTDKFNFVPGMIEKELNGVRKEFNDFKAEDKTKTFVATVGLEPANLDRNRFKNILCLDASRVKLSDGGYYHANAVDSRFILAQAPLPNTISHFWDLIQNEAVEAIVQLHPCDEGRKCAQYYPSQVGQMMEFGSFKVTNVKADPSPVEEPTLQFNQIKVQSSKGETKVKHIFWTNFPPVGLPEPSNTIPFIWRQIKGMKRVLVHCSSGAGRSAVVVLACQMFEKIQQAEEANAFKMLKELREKRHCAIRNEMQYVYVMRVVLFYFMKYNAVEMSQNLLVFIDDFDSYAKKYAKDEKERKDKPPYRDATEPSDEFNST